MALIHIAGNTYELIIENRNGWNVEAFRNRYSEVLERYDYIVGDWGYNQLRLKGFFKDGHQKATKDSTFSYITDYINEYCNFGCAYFLLEKKQGNESVELSDDDIYIEEVEYTRTIPVPAVKEAKTKSTASASAAEEAPASNQKDSSSRGKRSGQRDKQNDQAQDAGNEKQRQRNGQKQNAAKQQTSQLDNAAAEGKQDNKKEGKSKRKDHFYRKGNRYQDKKAKANKNQSEQMSSGSKS